MEPTISLAWALEAITDMDDRVHCQIIKVNRKKGNWLIYTDINEALGFFFNVLENITENIPHSWS